MDEIQPIKHFARIDLRKVQFLSERLLTQAELNVVLELIALADASNVIEPGAPLSRYMQERFCTSKVLINRYLKKIRELGIFVPLDSRPNAFRGMPFLFNRQKNLPGFWEYDGVNQTAEYVFGEAFNGWSTEGDGSRILSADSYARLSKARRKSCPTIEQNEHDKIVTDLKRKHTEEITVLKNAFTEVIEEENRKFAQALAEQDRKFKETLEMDRQKFLKQVKDTILDAIGELKKHDTDAAEKLERKHLRLIRRQYL